MGQRSESNEAGLKKGGNLWGKLTRLLMFGEVENDYEYNTDKAIIECFVDKNPIEILGVLVAVHAPNATYGQSSD